MPIVIPTARSTYADASHLPGNALNTYILAQLPSDEVITWVSEVRALIVVDELKWKLFQARREHLQAKGDLWKRIVYSMRSATIVVIRPQDFEREVRQNWTSDGMEIGVDYQEQDIVDACATALVADTPVAYLPNHISEMLGLYPQNLYLEFNRFAPAEIKKRIGGTLKDARVFAARAHATFDTRSSLEAGRGTRDSFSHPAAHLILRELLSTQRGFDEEHQPSARVLNEAAEVMASSLADALQLPGDFASGPLVREFSSRDVDMLQVADIAAGWAHELIALGNENALGATFGRVLINGVLMK